MRTLRQRSSAAKIQTAACQSYSSAALYSLKQANALIRYHNTRIPPGSARRADRVISKPQMIAARNEMLFGTGAKPERPYRWSARVRYGLAREHAYTRVIAPERHFQYDAPRR